MTRFNLRNRIGLGLVLVGAVLFLGPLLAGCELADLAAINQWLLDRGYTVAVDVP
jgi:hypothetical protein